MLVEAGFRCAIPTCRQFPVEVEHIDDYAKVKEHRFQNLIALCPTCHARKGSGSGKIDRQALRMYKANLAIINSRYSDTERRLLEYNALLLQEGREPEPFALPGGMRIQVWYLLIDGYVEFVGNGGVFNGNMPLFEYFTLTPSGVEFVRQWLSAQPLEPPEDDAEGV